MKTLYLIVSIIFASTFVLQAGDEKVNVISYYAVGNTLDGQPMIDMVNVLRFFPVFAMRDGIQKVTVTVYVGGSIFERDADCMSAKSYWEVLLPKFSLGEAIQRIEVRTEFRLEVVTSGHLADTLRILREARTSADREFDRQERRLTRLERAYQDSINNAAGVRDDSRIRQMMTLQKEDTTKFETFVSRLVAPESVKVVRAYVRQLARIQQERISNQRVYLESIDEMRKQSQTLSVQEEGLKSDIERDLTSKFIDTSYAGPSIRRSDVILDFANLKGYILYRNYKTSLRRMPALDPAERLGIFRARYVPFPIVGTQAKPRMNLKKPMSTSSPTVLEIGLAFGDAIVPGDEFVVPEFSWRRLGIAFAITERLFSDSAEVIGLALTYDFNSYGSIGIGGNFARNEVHGYASLGINKKAFEAVIKGLAGLFR